MNEGYKCVGTCRLWVWSKLVNEAGFSGGWFVGAWT